MGGFLQGLFWPEILQLWRNSITTVLMERDRRLEVFRRTW
jgi:hypothetical protein